MKTICKPQQRINHSVVWKDQKISSVTLWCLWATELVLKDKCFRDSCSRLYLFSTYSLKTGAEIFRKSISLLVLTRLQTAVTGPVHKFLNILFTDGRTRVFW